MDNRQFFDLIVQAQSALPRTQQNQRAASIIDALRRQLAVIEEPFTYESHVETLNNNSTQNDVIQIQADADFKLMATTYVATNDNGEPIDFTLASPTVNVLLTDTGNGRQLMEAPIAIPELFGTGQLPFIWPVPKIFAARSTLQVQYIEFGGFSWQYIQLAFIGVKLYPLPGNA